MSDMSDSGSSGLSDWALVNSQGEVESSEVASNASSIDVLNVEEEVTPRPEEAECDAGCLADSDSRESSPPECIELEQLMKEANEAAVHEFESTGLPSLPSPAEVETATADISEPQELGACCPELLQTQEKATTVLEKHGQTSDGCSSTSTTASSSSTSSDSLGTDVTSSLSELGSASRSSKSDSDNESDFVRLERESSSTNVTESEGEEAQAEVEGERTARVRISLSTSGSSVGSGFNFLAGPRASPPPAPTAAVPLLASLPPPPPPPQPPSPPPQLAVPVNSPEDAGDADTESSTEQDEDDRIESEQSDDANSAPPDDLDQPDLSAVSDIGDLPLVPGKVERHYVHQDNKQLNIKLNYIVITVVLVVFGLGLGHWIGSAREYSNQMEIQLAQMQRLHEIQDEYVQCLSRNDELLVSSEHILQSERDRHQEVMADLRDNNRELMEQLQDAQDQLEALLTKQRDNRHNSQNPDLHQSGIDGLGNKLTISELLFAKDEEFVVMASFLDDTLKQQLSEARQALRGFVEHSVEVSLNKHASIPEQDGSDLIATRQRVNRLEMENEELRRTIARQRYEHHPGNPAATPPPAPIPPPPLACPSQKDVEDLRTENSRLKNELLQYQQQTENDKSGAFVVVDRTSYSDVDADYDVTIEEVEEAEAEGHVAPSREQTQQPSEPKCEPVPVDVNLLQRNLSQERQRADMWRRLYISQKGSKVSAINTTACLQYLTQHMNASALMDYISSWNVTGGGLDDFANLTYLLSSISELQQNLMQSLPSLWDQLTATVHDIHNDFISQEEETEVFEEHTKSSSEEEQKGEESEEKAESGKQRKWSDGVKSLLNKTRATMSNVSDQLQQTWGKVREASQKLWPGKDSVFSRMAARVTEGVTRFSGKLHKKASSWFSRSAKPEKKAKKHNGGFEKDTADSLKQKENRGEAPKPPKHNKGHRKDRDTKHGKPEKHEKAKQKAGQGSKTPRHEKAHKDGKVPDRHIHQQQVKVEPESLGPAPKPETKHGKKTQTDQNTPTKKELKKENRRMEKKDGKVPKRHTLHHPSKADDKKPGKPDGDFEKQPQFHRQTKDKTANAGKLEKHFQKLLKKIGSYDERRFQRMDHDDVEDMLEDLQELQEHCKLAGDDKDWGAKRAWLACQLRWWRLAEQHQYMAEDECWRFLAPWQNMVYDIYHSEKHTDDDKSRQRQTPASPKGKREDGGGDGKTDRQKGQKESEGRAAYSKPDPLNTTDKLPEWYFNRVQGRDSRRYEEHRADWLFDRASDRDAARHRERSADWVFDRAAERGASRQDGHDDQDHQENDRFHHKQKKYARRHDDYRQRYGKVKCGLD